jgi:RNA polymerase sigma factor (TIGR02999 family)
MGSRGEVSRLLVGWGEGDEEALDRLMPLVYGELRRLAQHAMAPERKDHTLQATALVHEAYARLVGAEIEWKDRAHFFMLAARLMRRILVDHARSHDRRKRGGNRARVTLEETALVTAGPQLELIDLDDALCRLEELDPRRGKIVEMIYFGGLTYDEAATALDVSPATVKRDLRLARAWLLHELRSGDD